MPRPISGGRVELRFSRLDETRSWQREDDGAAVDSSGNADHTEKYGANSGYDSVRKVEDPGFIIDLDEALARTRHGESPRILILGVNTGDEIALIRALRPHWRTTSMVGVDHSASALALARTRFPEAQFHRVDLGNPAAVEAAELGRFDLVLAIAVLHSPRLDGPALLRRVVKEHLRPGASVIIGTPNCRYVDGEVLYGAKMRNFTQPDLSVLLKTVSFYKRYLNQHGFKVFVTGKHTILVTGVPERATPGP
jgi:SAM-dependent methyltransferase